MRIRRYAARLLASSAAAAAPQPPAPWLHAADDDCAFCDLTRGSDPQVAPDGVKHKGHIAGLQQPEGEPLETDEDRRARLPQRPPVLQAQECEVGHDHSASKGSARRPEGKEQTTLVSKAAAEPVVMEGALVADEAAAEQEVGVATPLVDGSYTEPEVTGGASLVSGLITETQVINGVCLADEAVAERVSLVSGSIDEPEVISGAALANVAVAETEVSAGLCFVSEAAIEAADVATTSGVTTGAPLDNKGVADPDTEMGAPTIHESASKAASEAADVAIVSEVTTGAPLDNKGVTEPDIKMGASPVDESASEAATEAAYVVTSPEVTTGAPLDNQRVAEPDIKMGASPVNECAAKTATEAADVVTNLRVTTVASFVNRGVVEPNIKMEASPAKESAAEMDFVHPGFLVTEAATHPGLPERVSLANEAVAEREVSEAGSLVSEPAAEAAGVVTVLEVTTGTPLDSEGTAEPETKIGPSFANESTAEMDSVLLGSLVTEATTHPGLIGRVSLVTETGVTGAANLDTEVSMEPEDTGRPSLINESTELEITRGVSIATDAATEPEVTRRASARSGDSDAALNEPDTLDCDLDSVSVQIENAGESVATEVQPSRDDGGDVVGSVNAMSTCPVTDKGPAFDEATPQDDAPSVSCVSGLVVRSVGKSGRTDVICYARRRGKRKLDMEETTTDQLEMGDGDIYGQCEEKATFDITVPYESAMSTAGSADIKLADIKRGLVDNSASSKGKKRKGRFECDIDYCHMTFKKRDELSLHKKNMCTIKSCGKHFRSHKYLRRHQSIHNEERPYKCPWEGCGMAFKWTWALADHFEVHTGEKPYKCRTPGCSKIYKYVSDFTRHRRRCKPQRVLLISCN
ncbi:zinc finger protein 236-like isoform X2 [Hordeum vulgare subsp. vulgare]|uniref:zinc finger protein 236-like isoform X2 n=2 Tax=Hordeum vulgare subsp. vulgare TaxID=112509 RepID=UPI001D1A54B7|nr:zinc finger protein 236-like isoform X2 [Hordeum vulgare subsp. vulgare]